MSLFAGLILLAACSSVPDSARQANSQEQMPTNYSAQMAEFEQMKPSLQRLAALEPELKELISQLVQIAQAAEMNEAEADANTTPTAALAAQKVPVVESTNSDTTTLPPQRAQAEPETSPAQLPVEAETTLTGETERGPYSLQLTAVTDKSKLASSWLSLQQRHKAILAELTAISQQVEVSGVTFYRIKAGFLNSIEEANKSCAALKQAKANCIVSDNRGEDIL